MVAPVEPGQGDQHRHFDDRLDHRGKRRQSSGRTILLFNETKLSVFAYVLK